MKHRSSNPKSTMGRFSLSSLFLGLVFFTWWLAWPWLSIYTNLSVQLQQLYFGLPLWFWLSSIVSLFILFLICLFFLPAEPSENSQQSSTKKQEEQSKVVQ